MKGRTRLYQISCDRGLAGLEEVITGELSGISYQKSGGLWLVMGFVLSAGSLWRPLSGEDLAGLEEAIDARNR